MENVPGEDDNPIKKLKVSTGTFPTVAFEQSVGIGSSTSIHVAKAPFIFTKTQAYFCTVGKVSHKSITIYKYSKWS
jgi:hypothetical protein